jgi:RND family efflux transporter MFP subunit
MENKMKIRIVVVTTILLAIVFGCSNNENQTEEAPSVVVKTAPVKSETIAFPVNTSGMLVSPKEIKLSFKVGGIIDKILVDDGAIVKKNQLLAALQKSEIEAMFQQAKSAYEKALRDYKRVSLLYEDSVATLEQKQDTETALEVARSNLKIADYNLIHASIVAPSDGKIIKRMAENNELIEPGTPVFIFGSTVGAWIIRTGVTDRDIVRLQHGDSARVTFDAHPGETFLAEVTEISQSADPYTGTFEIELTLNQQYKNLVFGFVADITIYPRSARKYFVIPIEALAEADGKTGTIYYLEPPNNSVKRTTVDIDRVFNGEVAIRTGLEGVEKVVTDGSAYLREGISATLATDTD